MRCIPKAENLTTRVGQVNHNHVLRIFTYRPNLCLLLMIAIAAATVFPDTTAYAQDSTIQNVVELPDDFDGLISTKTRLLDRFRKVRESGSKAEQVKVLFTIVSIHRKALRVALETKRGAKDVEQLQGVLLSDGEFLANELSAIGNFKQASTTLTEISALADKLTGKQSVVTQRLSRAQDTATRIAAASTEQQAAYLAAKTQVPVAQQAMQNRQAAVAEKIYQQLVDAEAGLLGENHSEVALHLNELGRAQWMLGKPDVAEKNYLRSLASREAATGKDLAYATTQFNLGRLYKDAKRFDESEKRFLAAAEIEEKILGPSNKSFVQTLQQLASVYEASGNSDKLTSIKTRIAAADPFNAVLARAPRNSYSGFIVEPASMLQNPDLQLMPFEVIEAAGAENLGFNPLDAEAIAGFFTLPIANEPEVVFVFRLRSGATTTHDWSKGMRTDKVPGATFLSETAGEGNNFVKLDDGTYLFGTEEAVRQTLTAAGPSTVTQMLAQDRGKGQLLSATDLKAVRAVLQVAVQEAPPLPQPFERLKTLPTDIDGIQIRIGLAGGLSISTSLIAPDAAAAKKSAEVIVQSMQAGMQMAMQEMDGQFTGKAPVERATAAYMRRVLQSQATAIQPKVNGNVIQMNANVGQSMSAPVLVGLLLPAVQQAREAARRTQSKNSLKQMSLAMLNYHDVHQKLAPAASVDKNGKPLLSWRVHLLPFMDEGELYKKFRLDEPWDSEHNLPLAQEIPQTFVSGSHALGNKTIYQLLVGKDTLFPEPGKSMRLADVTDGTSNTIMFVEANPDQAVIWTKPADIEFNAAQPMQSLGQSRPGGFQVSLVDGSVRFISANVSVDFLRAMMQPADGEVVEELIP